jgi:hypothetical protein
LDVLHVADKVMPPLGAFLDGLLGGIDRAFTRLDGGGKGAQFTSMAGQMGTSLGDIIYALADPKFIDALVALVGVLPPMVHDLAALAPVAAVFAGILAKILSLGPVSTVLGGILAVLLGYRMLSGVARSVVTFAESIGILKAELGTGVLPGGGPGGGKGGGGGGIFGPLGRKAGVASRGARLVRTASGALTVVAGADMLAQSLQGKETAGSDLSTVGGAAMIGAGIGSFIPGAGTLAGAGLGAALGGVAVGVNRLFGNHASPATFDASGIQYGQTWTPTSRDLALMTANPDAWGAAHKSMAVAIGEGAIVVNNPTDAKQVTDAITKYFNDLDTRQ